MPELQWILVGLALVALAAIYVAWNRRPARRDDTRSPAARRLEPVVHDATDDGATVVQTPPAPVSELDRKIVALRIAAKPGKKLDGAYVAAQLAAQNVHFGQYGIFHRYAGEEAGDPVFSVADIVEPGSFPSADLSGRMLGGLSLFMQLPGPVDGVRAFNELMDAAHSLADALDAEVRDASGSTVTRQTVAHLRDDIVNWMQRRAAATIPSGR